MTLHLEPAIELVDRSSKVDALPLSKELAQLGPLLQAEVVSHEVSVDAVFATLLGVVQDIRGCVTWAAEHLELFRVRALVTSNVVTFFIWATHPLPSFARTSSWR